MRISRLFAVWLCVVGMAGGMYAFEDAAGQASSDVSDLVKWGPASGKLGGALTVKWLNRYFFRGLRFSRNDVLQQDVGLWYEGFKLGGFFSYECSSKKYNETDVTLSYSYALRPDTVLEAGYTYFGYPNRVRGYKIKDTQEVFAGLSGTTRYLDASVYGYYDFKEGTGTFWEFGLGKAVDLDYVKPYVRATANLNARYFNDKTEFSHAILTVGVPVHITDHTIIAGSFNYQWGWQNWVEDKWYVDVGVTLRF